MHHQRTTRDAEKQSSSSIVYRLFFGISSVFLQWLTEEILKKYW
jgi:hypothetical protein